jgi:hypothetical protein
MSRRKVLCFFPQNPYPPRAGCHRRCLEMAAGLKEIGCEVTLLGSTLYAHTTTWEPSSIQTLKTDWFSDVHVYRETPLDYRFIGLLNRFYQLVKREPPVNSAVYSPPGMRRWFTRIFHEISPDMILMNYAYWDGLINHRRFKSVFRVIESLDLVTLNRQMYQAVVKYLPTPPISADQVEDHVLQEDFFEKLGLAVHPREFRVYDKYDYTIAISAKEADLIRQNIHKTKVSLIPMTQEPCYIPNSYAGPAVFPTGPNPYNIQGYLYFVKRVLPQVRSKVNSFSLQVTGYCCEHVAPAEGIVFSGFVPDIKTVYESSRFLVCPVFGGTGQQIKIIEAMAHGVPAIALRSEAQSSPIRHGVNGLVANDAAEFADYVVRLWKDRELCRQLGHAARETIAAELSPSRLLEGLSLMVELQSKK